MPIIATNWKIPVPGDVTKVIAQALTAAADANVGAGVVPNQTTDPTLPLRSQAALALAVQRLVGAVTNGGRIAVSATPGAVPPEAEQHALVLAAWIVTASTPNLGQVVIGPNGNVSPFYNEYQKAEKWITDVSSGKLVPTTPSDPLATGVIGTVDNQPVTLGTKWGDLYGTDQDYLNGTQRGAAPFSMTTDG